jgi:hypothetical protein
MTIGTDTRVTITNAVAKTVIHAMLRHPRNTDLDVGMNTVMKQ